MWACSHTQDTGKSAHDILFFYGGHGSTYDHGVAYPYAARLGRFKAHWRTGPGLGGCKPSPAAPIGCPSVVYSAGPLLFDVDQDPSEQFPLCMNTTTPKDPELVHVIKRLEEARADILKDVVPHESKPAPDGPGEGPGKYGVCCNRTMGCDCDGPPRV